MRSQELTPEDLVRADEVRASRKEGLINANNPVFPNHRPTGAEVLHKAHTSGIGKSLKEERQESERLKKSAQ